MSLATVPRENSFVFPTQADCMAQRWRVRNHEGVLARLFHVQIPGMGKSGLF